MSSVDRVGDAREQWWPAWLVAGAVLLAAAILMQQFSRGLHEATLDRAPPARVNSEKLQSPGVSELTVASKVAAKSAYLARLDEAEETDLSDEQAQIDAAAVSRPERLRAAIMAGELLGAAAARQRLDALAAEADPAGDLAGELHWLGVLYREGRAAVPPEAQDSLVDRHGWFGRLALSHGMPDSDRHRRELLRGLERVARVLIWTVLASLLALVIGLFALGALWSRMRQGLLQRGFEERPAGVVYLETAVLFIGGFVLVLGLSLVPFGMGAEGTTGALALHELLTWSLVGVLAWPVLRTVWRPKEPPPAPPRTPPARPRPAIQPAPPPEPPQRRAWRSFARGIGLDTGSGLAAEAGFGVVGYLAGLPLTVGAAIAASWLEGETESGPQGPPLFEPPETGSWVLLLLGTLSAIVWAPILEECVFRGCLYRWLRGKLRAWLAILITAAVFGLVHPYSPAGLLVVGVGGLMFGALREWRGSLVAPITAHFLHNATISLVTIAYLLALGD